MSIMKVMKNTSIPIGVDQFEKLIELRFEYRARSWFEFWSKLVNLHPRCPNCGSILVRSNMSNLLICPRCRSTYVLVRVSL